MSKVVEYTDDKLYHVVVSLDKEVHAEEFYTLEWMRKDMKTIAKMFTKCAGETGGVFITFHPGTTKKHVFGWIYQPHFHIVTNCYVDKSNYQLYRDYLYEKGICAIVRNLCLVDSRDSKAKRLATYHKYPKKCIGTEEVLCRIIKYELSHCFSTQEKGKHHHFSYGMFCNNKYNIFKKIDKSKPWVIEEVIPNKNTIHSITELTDEEVENIDESKVKQLYDEDEYNGNLDKIIEKDEASLLYFTVGKQIMKTSYDGFTYPAYGTDTRRTGNYRLKNRIKKRYEKQRLLRILKTEG